MSESNELNFSTVRAVNSAPALDIRLLVLDLDGTIVDESNHIRDSVAEAVGLIRRREVAVAIATGRMYASSLPAYDFIGSTQPLICYEGGLIRERSTSFIHRHWPLEPGVVAQILDFAERLGPTNRLSVHFHIEDNLYVSNLNDASLKFFERSTVEPQVMDDMRELITQPTTKVQVLSDDAEVISQLASQLSGSCSRIQVHQYKSVSFLEAFHPAVNKRLAVSYLAEEIMGIRPENVMAVGNDFTDIAMLQYAGIGVAMGDAPSTVKASADWVTTTLEDDGVARAIERWILRAKSNATRL